MNDDLGAHTFGSRGARGRARRVAGALILALLAGACGSGGDGGGGSGDESGGGDTAAGETTTTTGAPTTTAPLGPPDAAVQPALLTPGDLPDAMWEFPFGTRDEYRPTPRDRSRVDELTVEPGPCAEVIAGYLTSTGAGPSLAELTSADGRLVIEQRVDREADAGDRWEPFAEAFPDACATATVTTADGAEAEATAGNVHLVQAGVELYSLAIEASGEGPRGHVLFVRDATTVHVLSAFTTAGTDVITQDGLYDLVTRVSVPAQQKLMGTLG